MNEYIVAAIIWLNEAKSLLAVEPLDRTCCHNLSLFRIFPFLEFQQRITTVPLKNKIDSSKGVRLLVAPRSSTRTFGQRMKWREYGAPGR
jgi:hypothetical protein